MGKERYYHIRTTTSDGAIHDSRKEANRWCELTLLERAGKISNLQRQVPFELLPAQYESFERYGKNGKRLKDGQRCIEKSVVYIADFVYNEDGKRVVEDVKSAATKKKESYIIKRKLLLWVYGIKLRET
jgi:hypothetical protein